MENSSSSISKNPNSKMKPIPNHSKQIRISDLNRKTVNSPSDDSEKRKSTTHSKKTLTDKSNSTIYGEASNYAEENISSPANEAKLNFREKTRNRHPGARRMKIRSLRDRTETIGARSGRKRSIGIDSIDWGRERSANALESRQISDRASDHESMCRICHGYDGGSTDSGPLVTVCRCRGTVGRIHVKCLERWLTESGKSSCELCGVEYAIRRFHRYGVFKGLLMWMLSQNTKQLLVDVFGIVLMSPLAALAAWLSGRTLSALVGAYPAAPWPLASTFVLACMTLMCYYCWLVAAASRHALAWWVWYRSQYEVRLLYGDHS